MNRPDGSTPIHRSKLDLAIHFGEVAWREDSLDGRALAPRHPPRMALARSARASADVELGLLRLWQSAPTGGATEVGAPMTSASPAFTSRPYPRPRDGLAQLGVHFFVISTVAAGANGPVAQARVWRGDA